MRHPLKCRSCGQYCLVKYFTVQLKDEKINKGFFTQLPFLYCAACGSKRSVIPRDVIMKAKRPVLKLIRKDEFFDVDLKNLFSKLDSAKRFAPFEHLGFDYDPRDLYVIPGLSREWDDGYLTPVFFDKDLLIYYNNHPDYSVKFTSFSSCNIYFRGNKMFSWGFGINRSGNLFKWLGDLDQDFGDEAMKPHLKRFQASNIPSDHDVFSKFYLSQNPFSEEDMFQISDNETRLFALKNSFSIHIKKSLGIELDKIEIEHLSEYYRSPIMDDREQVFGSFLSLNKIIIENLQEAALRSALLERGIASQELENNGRRLGSLKLFSLFLQNVLHCEKVNELMAPLFVLNDLRHLHGHISNTSFEDRYTSCKTRLELPAAASDIEVFRILIKKLIDFYKDISGED